MARRGVTFLQKLKTKVGAVGVAMVLALTSSAGLPLAIVSADPLPSTVSVCATGCDYTTIQDSIDNVAANGTIALHNETYIVNSAVNINKAVTLAGQAGTTIQTNTPAVDLFTINAAGVSIVNINFVATTQATFSFFRVNANNATINGNTFSGQYHLDAAGTDGSVSRGIVGGGGRTGLTVNGNTFNNLRQPAYFDAVSGNVVNNKTSGTKGWVIVSQSNINFAGNTWGSGVAKNAVDIAVVADPGVQPDNYLANLMQMSSNNNNAVIEDQTPSTGRVMTDVFVDASAPAINNNGYPITPYQVIAPAMARVTEGGRIHVANGTYVEKITFAKNGTQLLGQSRAGVVITPLLAQYGQGLAAEGLSNITVKDLTLKATTASGGYALKVHNGSNYTVNNVTLIGPGSGTPRVGGLDINGVSGVSLTDVSVSGFTKNGIAITSQDAATDPMTKNVSLNSVTSTGNAWSGLAFYTSNNAATVGGNIENVSFSGSNSFTNNGQVGVFVEGDSDTNYNANAAPRFNVTGPAGALLNLGTTEISGNAVNIINYQTKGIKAFATTFGGKTGNQMNTIERQATDASIVDQLDFANRGLVAYYTLGAPTNLTPLNNTFTTNNSFDNTWDTVPGAAKYEYRTANSVDGNGDLGTVIYSDTSDSANYAITSGKVTRHNNSAPDAAYYWQVRAIDGQGNPGAWSTVNLVTVDTTAPTVPTNGLPNGTYTNTNEFDFTWNASSDNNSVTYEYQATQNPAQTGGVLTTGLWQSGVLTTPNIHSTGAADGNWYWQVRAKDAAGNYSAWSPIWSINIDTVAPAAPGNVHLKNALNQAIANNGFTNSYQISVNWNEVSDAHHYQYKYWNNIPGSTYNSGATAYIVDAAGTTLPGEFNQGEGTHYMSVRSIDAAGNASDWSAPIVVTYDNTKPTLGITSPTQGEVVNGNTLTVKGTANDTNLDYYQYYIMRADGSTVGYSKKSYTRVIDDTLATFDISTLPNGTYTVRFIAQDKAGNRVDQKKAPYTVQFVIQRTIPAPPSNGGFGGGTPAATPLVSSTASVAPSTISAQTFSSSSDDQAINTTSAVLGESTQGGVVAAATSETPEIKAASTDKSGESAAQKSDNQKFLGLGWWWLLILAIAAGIFYGLFRRSQQEQEN